MFVIVTRNFPPDVGGIQNLMEGLSLSLLNHGPVKVFADSFEGSENYDKSSKLEIIRVSGFKIFKKYRKANLLNEFAKSNQIRALFFDHWKSVENINQEILDKSKSFCLIHSKEINHEIGSSLNKRMLKALIKPKLIIANSNFTKDLAISLGVDKNKIFIINPGCNYPIKIQEEFSKQAKEIYDNAFPKIITIARLDKRKSHQNILMVIKNLKAKFPKIKYISIGDGEEKDNLVDLRDQLGLQNDAIFAHQIHEQLKVALLDHSDLFLMPSIIHKKSVEGFGISFIEAACYGKGSIGGIEGGEKDAIINGKTGYLCDGKNINSIYETVLKFFDNDNYKNFGANALEFSKQFSWNKVVKKYIDLI